MHVYPTFMDPIYYSVKQSSTYHYIYIPPYLHSIHHLIYIPCFFYTVHTIRSTSYPISLHRSPRSHQGWHVASALHLHGLKNLEKRNSVIKFHISDQPCWEWRESHETTSNTVSFLIKQTRPRLVQVYVDNWDIICHVTANYCKPSKILFP